MIDKTSYTLTENNYYQVEYKKNQIVIGHSGRKEMRHFGGWINRRNGKHKKGASFTIDKEGTIYQHFDPKYYTDFVGVEQDKSNISIVLVNEGWLELDKLNNIYIDWLGHTYSKKSLVKEQNWRNHKYWMRYTDEQMLSLKELVLYLCEEFKIKKDFIGHCVYDEDADIFNGITFRSNYKSELTDVSPAFEMDILNKL
jgi:hypothetical protein